MNAHAGIPVFFASRGDTLRDLGSGFRGDYAKVDTGEIIVVILAAVAAVVVFWLLARWARREAHGAYNSPKQLFRRLAAAHGLTFVERRLLAQAARHVQVPFAACLFLRPDLFDAASAHSQLASRADELHALKAKLFTG